MRESGPFRAAAPMTKWGYLLINKWSVHSKYLLHCVLVSFQEYHPEVHCYFFYILASSVTMFSTDVIYARQHMTPQFYEPLLISYCMPGACYMLLNLILAITVHINLYIIFELR